MSTYNFKKITTVPTAKEFIDFTLSKTQRKTPTVVHKQYNISRIRKFYMRKVKFTQQNFHDRINTILTEFPKLEDMHPFYADLLNTLYNKDHYKLSLGQLNTAMHLIGKVAADYVKLLKYADSLYRCKQLKRAALGRMATIMKKQGPPLRYLEEIRQHMSRLPSIDPNARTLILCGCPNAGKSSFINLVTRADVEVQPYAFTTKSLYIGHTDYEYLRWQVIDTPGILDRPFDEMNTIELQAITALAHIKAAIVFFLDVSEQCNVAIDQQMKIFESIRPLFSNKPLIVACNKTDVTSLAELAEQAPEKRELIAVLEREGIPVIETSTLTQKGVMEIKKEACDRLLAQRVDLKLRSKKADSILNRIHVAMPSYGCNEDRKPCIPEAVLRAKEKKRRGEEEDEEQPKRKLEKDLMYELMEDYILDLNKTKDLANPDWKYDKMPDYIDGYNVADFIDPDIMKKLEQLEEEEDIKMKAGIYDLEPEPYTKKEMEILKLGKKIGDKLLVKAVNRQIDHSNTRRAPMPRPSRKRQRSVSNLRRELSALGVDMSDTKNAHFTRTQSKSRPPIKKARTDSLGRVRSSSRAPRDESGVRDAMMLTKVKRIERRNIKSMTNKRGQKAESDRHIIDKKPKHLFAGKRGAGKTDRR